MSFRRIILIALLLIFAAIKARAEIRVFLLRISKRSDPQDFRLVKSSLDPLQYPYFYHVGPDEIVTYDDTWRCRGNTGNFQELCKSPREIASEAASNPESSQAVPAK